MLKIAVPILALCSLSWTLPAQRLMLGATPGAKLHLFGSDLAVMEAREKRDDLACQVTMNKPALGFDMKYHATYEVTLPVAEVAGSENILTIVFRVTPADNGEPVYFTHRIRVPEVEDESKGEAYFVGTFDIGEGKYQVDWLMRDRSERVCAHFFDVEARLPEKEREIRLDLQPNVITQTEPEQFRDEPPVSRQPDEALNIKVLVNFAPQNSKSALLQPTDTQALVSILRGISRDPRVRRFSLVAFNLQEQRVIYKAENADKIDFPAIGQALDSLKLGTIDIAKLAQKNGETTFLANLIKTELASTEDVDAVVFAGPKALLDANVPAEDLRDVGEVSCPVFYMNYNLYPREIPWRDSIGTAVKFWRGAEYTITRPRDLWAAVSEMMTRVVKSRRVRTSSLNSPAGLSGRN